MMRRIAVCLVTTLLATGCIWDPDNRTEREKGATLQLSGYTSGPRKTVYLSVRNNDSGALASIGSVTSGTTEAIAGSGLYSWAFNATAAAGQAYNWAPAGLGPYVSAGGSMGRFELVAALADGTQLGTFTASAKTCVANQTTTAADLLNAGINCHDGRKLVQYDNTGINTSTADPNTLTWESNYQVTAEARADFYSYKSQGLTIYAVVCQPKLHPNPHPVHILNHGGGAGIFPADVGMCMDFAKKGWVTAMSAYRGERAVYSAYKSEGKVEVNLGEVIDVLRLLKVVNTNLYTNPNQVLMTGFSHGGGITTRAVQQGAPVQAAIDAFGPGDWTKVYNCNDPAYPDVCPAAKGMLDDAINDNPSGNPLAYKWRSPGYRDANSDLFPGDLGARTNVKFMIQHGTLDKIVTVDQSCQLALDAWGSSSQRFYVTTAGSATTTPTTPPTGCTQSWSASSRPTGSAWNNPSLPNRFLMVYENAGHDLLSLYLRQDYYRFIDSLGWPVTAFGY